MNSRIVLFTLLFFCVIFQGNTVAEISSTDPLEKTIPQAIKPESKAQTWTCSMHPHIKMPKPGKCPICGMDLIPVSDTSGQGAGPREYSMSESAKKLAEIVTEPVVRKYVDAKIRMVGKVDYDETRVGYITAWIPGRLDKLYVDYTGVPVQKGDHMVYLYSPELLAAQEELLQAVKSARRSGGGKNKYVANMAYNTLRSAREKLRLWGLTPEQIKDIEKRSKPSDHLTIYAPMSGIVVHKAAFEGMYVETGTKIYTIADLSRLWIKLDAYESDLMWIRYGQKVEFTSEAYPGDIFRGRISFIDPVLNQKTRTVKVRVNVDNPEGKLKPGMFVRAEVHANVAEGGRVMDTELSGKWICPMHPDFLSSDPGKCDICGMTLRKTESLGYVKENAGEQAPLVVPVSAVLKTGTRAVVYVQVPGREQPTFEGREVVLGARAGDYYLIDSGLSEGERVVTNGNFKIDSALQILAKPSMMSPEGGVPMAGHSHHGGMSGAKEDSSAKVPELFKKQIFNLVQSYLKVQELLAKDDVDGAVEASKKMKGVLGAVDMKLLEDSLHDDWMKISGGLKEGINNQSESKKLQALRTAFVQVSENISEILDSFGFSGNSRLYLLSCPVAFGWKGASWIQEGKVTMNSYMGSAMPGCGKVVKEYRSMEN